MQTAHNLSASLRVPQSKQFYLSDTNINLLEAVQRMSEDGEITNVMISGPQGSGKSELVNQFAARNDRPLAVFEVGRLAEATEIFGQLLLNDGQTYYEEGLFTKAIQQENAVIHLQELNRPETDKALNALFSVLDPTFRSIYIDEIKQDVKVARGVTIFATMNQGFDFVGTMPLDQALQSRFDLKIELERLPHNVERQLLMDRFPSIKFSMDELTNIVADLRGNTQTPVDISTREVIAMARLMQYGISTKEAIVAGIDTTQENMENLLLQLHLADKIDGGHESKNYRTF